MTYKIICADSHMCEPPTLRVDRIERRFRDQAPRVVKHPVDKKGHLFMRTDLPPLRLSGVFAAGRRFNQDCMEAGPEDALPGGWNPAARLEDLELDGIQAEVLYATCAFVLFRLEDAALQQACFRVYNGWLAEFCRQKGYQLADPSVLKGRSEFEGLFIQTIFPCLIVQQIANTLAVRQVLPKAPDRFELIFTYFGYEDSGRGHA